jgi:hypothetical protein
MHRINVNTIHMLFTFIELFQEHVHVWENLRNWGHPFLLSVALQCPHLNRAPRCAQQTVVLATGTLVFLDYTKCAKIIESNLI